MRVSRRTEGAVSTVTCEGLETRLCLSAADPTNATIVGDFDGDGKTDLLVVRNVGSANDRPTTLTVVDPATGAASKAFSFPHVLDVRAADVDRDGDLDVITAREAGSGLATGRREAGSGMATGRRTTFAVLLNQGQDGEARFTPAKGKVWGDPHVDGIDAVGDFNGDGRADLIVHRDLAARFIPGVIDQYELLIGKGDGSFDTRRTWVIPHILEVSAVGDFNGDGHADLAWTVKGPRDAGSGIATGRRMVITTGDGTGGFDPAGGVFELTGAFEDGRIVVGDVDGDGSDDMIAFAINEQGVKLTAAGFAIKENGIKVVDLGESQSRIAIKEQGVRVAAGDLDGDGRADLVAIGDGGSVHVATNTFKPGQSLFSEFKELSVKALLA